MDPSGEERMAPKGVRRSMTWLAAAHTARQVHSGQPPLKSGVAAAVTRLAWTGTRQGRVGMRWETNEMVRRVFMDLLCGWQASQPILVGLKFVAINIRQLARGTSHCRPVIASITSLVELYLRGRAC
jgi:hypothetical protein